MSGKISDIDSTLALLDTTADQDAVMKLNFIKSILGSDLFGRRRKRSEESRIKYFNDLMVKRFL